MLHAGAGQRDITPTARMYLGGYLPTRQWTAIHDPLSVRAVALRTPEATVILMAADSIGILRDLADRIRAAVAVCTGVPADQVFIAATHSHSTPDTMGIYGDTPAWYRAHLVVQAAGAALAAWNTLAPVRVRWTQVDIPDVSMNRRVPAGELDRQCTVLQFARPDGETVATVTNLSVHPVCLGPDNQVVTADFVHYLRTRIESRLGGMALHTNGTEGNVNPFPQLHPEDRLDRTGGTFTMAEEMGHTIADAACAALADATWFTEAPIETRRGTCTLPVENPVFVAAIESGTIVRELTDGVTTTPVGFVRIGDVRLVTFPGEAFAEIGLRIKAWWPKTPACVIGMCDDHIGYVIPPDLFDEREYEESVSASARAWPALERGLRAVAGL